MSTFSSRMKRIFFLLLSLFLLLFIFRLAYGYTKTINQQDSQSRFFSSLQDIRKNYASEKFKFKKGGGANVAPKASPTNVDQKFEKVATIKSDSRDFENDKKSLKNKIQQYNGIIQFENNKGKKGSRQLHLLIGIQPDRFDEFYNELIGIGNILLKEITKKDKTNEYKELNARKNSLEKIRNSLIELKSKSGKIDEYISLENRILEIEEKLQDLGVSLGNFDEENEFCTVRFSLIEGKEVQISFLHRVKVALDWTVKTYLQMTMSLFFVGMFAYFLTAIIDKFKIMNKIFDK